MAELKHQIPINVRPEKVYAALATSSGLKGWWTADSRADEKVGGKAEFGFDKRGMVFRMTIEKLDPGKEVVWSCQGDHPEWDGTMLTWTIVREQGGSTLRFTQSGWKSVSEFCATCNATWGELLYRLKAYVENGRPDPHWRE